MSAAKITVNLKKEPFSATWYGTMHIPVIWALLYGVRLSDKRVNNAELHSFFLGFFRIFVDSPILVA